VTQAQAFDGDHGRVERSAQREGARWDGARWVGDRDDRWRRGYDYRGAVVGRPVVVERPRYDGPAYGAYGPTYGAYGPAYVPPVTYSPYPYGYYPGGGLSLSFTFPLR
jgi:hypothetical protein